MRYIKLLVFVLVVLLSKSWMEKSADISLDTHLQMQSDLEIILQDAILLAVPTAKDIRNENLATKVLSKDKVIITFDSQFLAEPSSNVKVILAGEAIIERIYEEGLPTANWSIESFRLGDEEIEFSEDVLIEVDPTEVQWSPLSYVKKSA